MRRKVEDSIPDEVIGFFSIGLNPSSHSPPTTVDVKNAWIYTSTPPTRLHGVMLNKLG
jgi:hypothetical protein